MISILDLERSTANVSSGVKKAQGQEFCLPYFRDQTPPSISSRPRIIAAPPEVLNEIVAALE